MEYTEKTSGEQLKKLLTMLFGTDDIKTKYDNSCIGFYSIELPSVGEIHDALTKCGINPQFVTINDMWDKLTLWVYNYDGTEI